MDGMKNNKRIEIVRSSMKSLSSMSQESADAILSVLTQHYTKVSISTVNNLSDLEAVVERKPDLIFMGMECVLSDRNSETQDAEKIWLASYFDERGIVYTGSNQSAHELERNKHLAKQHILDSGIKTARFCVIDQNHQPKLEYDIALTFPLFIKPTNRGGGFGIDGDSIVYNFEQLLLKISSIKTNFHSDSLIEEYLPGREFSVAVLRKEDSAEFSLMPIELIAPPDRNGARILSSIVKSANIEQAIGITDHVIKSQITTLALNAFRALGARDYGRIDIRLDKHGTPHFLEANLIPSLISEYGSFPKACILNTNLDFEPMIMRITKLGLERCQNNIKVPPAAIIANTTISPRLAAVI